MRAYAWPLIEGATHIGTIVAVCGATVVWRRRALMVNRAFYAGVTEGRALERLAHECRRVDRWRDDGGSSGTSSSPSAGRR